MQTPTQAEYENAQKRFSALSDVRMQAIETKRWEAHRPYRNMFYWLNREMGRYERVCDAYLRPEFEDRDDGGPFCDCTECPCNVPLDEYGIYQCADCRNGNHMNAQGHRK